MTMIGMMDITMLNRIKQMTVSLLLTVIQTDETSQRDIYKCLRIRLPASTTMITSIRFKTAPKLSHITANSCKLSNPKLGGRNIGCDKDNIDDAMVKILFWGLPKPSLPLFNSFLLVNLVR